jgi:alpha-L-fucosidase
LAEADWENVNLDYGNITNPPTIGNGSLSLGTSGIATGSQTFTANQTGNATFTVNVPGTNIAQGTRTTTTVPVTSSTGTNATLSAATTSLAGVMTSADKTKLDGIADGAQVNVGTNLGTAVVSTNSRSITSSTGSNVTVPNATTTVAGFMSHTDKSKLDGIAAGAQVNVGTNLGITAGSTAGPIVTSSTGTNATLPIATATASGVITTGNQTFAGTKTFNSTITGSISGNAGTATTLANTRSINGTNFNGSANITTAN